MMLEATYLLWIFGAALVLLLVWLAWQRPNRRRLLVRVLASILAGLSLVCIAFPPSYEKTVDPSTAILLTDGYSPDSLNAILKVTDVKPAFYSYQARFDNAVPVNNLYTLRQQQPQLNTVHLLGNGLTAPELEALKGVSIIPHLSAQQEGITSINRSTEVALGKMVQVSGQYNSLSEKPATLYFAAAGRAQDSVKLKKGLHPFELSFTPKQEGRFVYQVLTKFNGKTDTLGQVPVQVLPADKLRILLFSAAPLFEFKFLKNHLAELQHQVAFRSTVSKGITQSEWVNMPQTNLNRITPNLLNQFDLVITEPQALRELSTSERNALEQAVTSNGLGALTIREAAQPHRSTDFFTKFNTRQVSRQETRTTNAVWEQRKQTSVNALPYAFTRQNELIGLIREEGNNYLAAARKEGWGTVAVSLIPQTFSWKLEGKQDVYASYWAYLLSAIAKKKEQEKFWHLKHPQAPKQNQPVTLSYTDYTLTESELIPETTVRSITDSVTTRLAMQQDMYLPEQFTATYWPQQKGWHVVETPNAPDFHFYVQDSLDWQHEAIQEKRVTTQKFAAQQNINSEASELLTTKENVPIYWFFILFVLSSGFLWLEEKL